MTLYDTIGINYAELRRPDPRIARAVADALGPARTVLNVGAGAGSYEPVDRAVTAAEPSVEMIRKRSPTAAQAIQASAGDLPFENNSFDAAMAILTIHHWPNKAAGLREMKRVARDRLVLLTFDPTAQPWLTDYFPELITLDEAQMPAMKDYERWFGPVSITPVPVPHNCTDGFLYAYWQAGGVSRSAHSIGQLVVLDHRWHRSWFAKAGERSRNWRVEATLSPLT